MIELVFTVCMLAQPLTCEQRYLTFANLLTPMQCLMGAQVELARWSEAHPKWRISEWRCRTVSTASRDA